MIEPGDTFLKLDRWNHLWFAISLSNSEGEVAIANLTTHRPELPGHEACQVLQPGDHPYIRHDSCIYYRGARLISAELLEDRVATGASPRHETATRELLRRIQDAAIASRETDAAVKRVVQNTLVREETEPS